jgi:hypothetical protein
MKSINNKIKTNIPCRTDVSPKRRRASEYDSLHVRNVEKLGTPMSQRERKKKGRAKGDGDKWLQRKK